MKLNYNIPLEHGTFYAVPSLFDSFLKNKKGIKVEDVSVKLDTNFGNIIYPEPRINIYHIESKGLTLKVTIGKAEYPRHRLQAYLTMEIFGSEKGVMDLEKIVKQVASNLSLRENNQRSIA